MANYILALDQGTTGSTALLVGEDGHIVARANQEFRQIYPKAGWVEHALDEIWESLQGAVTAVLQSSGIDPTHIAAIGITNQRETTAMWERKSGKQAHNAIVWQDVRTADFCDGLSEHEALFRDRTGLIINAYFSGSKIRWMLDNVEGLRSRVQSGDVICGTIDSWMVHRLSGGDVHITDATNASRTLLYNIREGRWDAELCEIMGVPVRALPEVRSCAEVYAKTKGALGLPDGIPIAGIAGDQQAALFGQACFDAGDAKCTFGTGAFLLMNIGKEMLLSDNRLLTTVAWRLGDEVTYAFEGASFIAGAAVQWLRDGLGLIKTAPEIEALASQVDSCGDVTFVPALSGLGAPYWDSRAQGLICGLTRDSTSAHIARAALEGIAFQIHDLATSMANDAKRNLANLRVDGGASANDLLMQFQADILDARIDRPKSIETTALGATYLAGMGVGLYSGYEDVRKAYYIDTTFEPTMDERVRNEHIRRWGRAVGRARSVEPGGQ